MALRDYATLRRFFDGKDPYMNRPNVVKDRTGRSNIPEGMTSDNFPEWLIKRYPLAWKFNRLCLCYWCGDQTNDERRNNKCKCRECKDTRLMFKWWTVITEHFFGTPRKTAKHVEKEQGWNNGTVGNTVQQITLAWAGLRQDKKPRTGRPRGRPKKQPIDRNLEGIFIGNAINEVA
jgi:hypothetical protein